MTASDSRFPALRRAISSLGCPGATLEETLALAARHGLAGVELRALGGSLDLPAYFEQTFSAPAALAEKLRGAPVRVVALDTSFQLIGGAAADRAALLRFAPWAEALGGVRLRVFDGGKTGADDELARAAENARWWRTLRRERGWRTDLMVETHDTLTDAGAIRRFWTAAPDCAILWDTHHTWRKGGEDPLATWAAIKSGVVHVHVKDSVNRPSARHPYTYVPPGEGEFPAATLLAALQADGFAGPVCLEWEKLWHPYLPELDAALAVAARRNWW